MSQDCDNIYKESVTERPVAELRTWVDNAWLFLKCLKHTSQHLLILIFITMLTILLGQMEMQTIPE